MPDSITPASVSRVRENRMHGLMWARRVYIPEPGSTEQRPLSISGA
jgi:hypothetical protein